jgi:hypothetical protein
MKLKLQNWHIPFLDKHEFNLELTPQTPTGCLLTFATVVSLCCEASGISI